MGPIWIMKGYFRIIFSICIRCLNLDYKGLEIYLQLCQLSWKFYVRNQERFQIKNRLWWSAYSIQDETSNIAGWASNGFDFSDFQFMVCMFFRSKQSLYNSNTELSRKWIILNDLKRKPSCKTSQLAIKKMVL